MTEENIIKLTSALYKVTGLFPKEEPLKFAIRKEALDVLYFTALVKGESITIAPKEREYYFKKAAGKIDLIGTYFDICREQEWIDARNFDILQSEYSEMKKVFISEISKKEVKRAIAKEPEEEEEEPEKEKTVDPEKKTVEREEREVEHLNYEDLSNAQLRVLEILQGKGEMKSNQLSQFFPEMNPRTVRRELKGLKEMKIITTAGGGKTTVYKINQTF
jgi:hypothetical protein